MKKILALILCLAMVFALAACGDKPADAKGEEGGTEAAGSVYWLNFKPESDEVLQKVAAMYTEKTGVPVKVVTAAAGTYSQTLTSEMDKSSAPTIFIVGTQAGVKDWADYALDLTGTPIAQELNTDAYNLYDENGKLVSIGYCYECYGIIVNPDLLEKAGHSLDEIKNFETLKAVAEDIHARADELGFDAFSSSDMDPSSSWRFTGHMANLEYFYEERDAGGWTECPATLTGAYMENFKNLYDLCINNSLTDPKDLATGGHDAENEFKTGKAAFFVNGSWEYSAVSEAVPNATMIPYYCGVAGEEKAGLNCGTENCWAINGKASEADQKATMDFLVWCVTDPEASRLLVDSFGVMPYTHAAESTNGFLAAANEYSNNGCYVMDWATNYQPNVDDYRAALVSALNQYNADQSAENWATVVTAFVDGWATQYQKANG
ncbi:MAG: ABC transporter substrate-binding protein [Oscillospiraceae bacterium]|nr:ABC transporter substrate-binding protein [Oscillospiraceae bacterium]